MLSMTSQDALSAVLLAGQVAFVFNLYLTSLAIGTSMLAAQYWRDGDGESTEKLLAFALRTSLTVSLAFCLGTLFLPRQIMYLFTSEQALIDGAPILRTTTLSYLLCGISQIYLCIMKNTDLAIKSTCISSMAVSLNKHFLKHCLYFRMVRHSRHRHTATAIATIIVRSAEAI